MTSLGFPGYGHIYNLELYPGLQAGDLIPIGLGLCRGEGAKVSGSLRYLVVSHVTHFAPSTGLNPQVAALPRIAVAADTILLGSGRPSLQVQPGRGMLSSTSVPSLSLLTSLVIL